MLSATCMNCLVARQMKMLDELCDNDDSENTEVKKARYMKEVFEILSSVEKGAASPVAVERMDRLFKEYFGKIRSFDKAKAEYNDLILEKEEQITERVMSSDDRLLCALKFSRIGNYIDFGALKNVKRKELEELIFSAPDSDVDPAEYSKFRRDLEKAKNVLFITDNCGEIVFDKVFLKTLKAEYPTANFTVLVRGKPVLNDATADDAAYVGIDKIAPVVSNGSGVAGTYIPSISNEAKALLDSADVIIAKGQGNFETMFGCGLNVYYAFLCKCTWFEKRFGMKHLEGVFTCERSGRFTVSGSTL